MTYQSEVLADSPALYWRLDERVADAANSTGEAYIYSAGVTAQKTPLVADGGASVSGPGTTAIARRPSIPASLAGASVSFEAWVNIPAGNVSGGFITIGANTSNGWGVGVGGTSWDNTGKQLILLQEGIAWQQTGFTLTTGVHHVVVTRSAANLFTAYVDGVSRYTGTWTPNAPTGPVSIGGTSTTARALSSTVDIDNVALYASVLSSARVAAHYAATSTYSAEVLADSPVDFLRFDDATATDPGETTPVDSSGNARSGTHVGSPAYGRPSLLGSGNGRSVSYVGGQYTTIGSAAWMNSATVTVEARIRVTSAALSGQHPIVTRWSGNGATSHFILWLNAGKVEGIVRFGSGGQPTATDPNTLTVGDHTVTLTYDGTDLKVFVDGAKVVTTTSAGSILSATGASFDIARVSGSVTGVVQVDEVSFTAAAISEARVATRHAAAIATSGNVTGSVAASLPALTAAAAGTVSAPPVTGAVGATLPALTATSTGTHTAPSIGAVAATLPALSAAVTGTHTSNDQAGEVAVTLPSLGGSVAGTFTPAVVTGSVTPTLPALSGSVAGSAGTLLGSVAVGLPSLTAGVAAVIATGAIPTDPTDIPFGTEDGELDALPALDPTPPGMVQRPLWRRSVIVPRLKDIPGVIIDPETSQPRIPAAVYATFPVIEEEVGVPHVIFPGRDGVHDMTYYRRNRSRIVSTRAEEPFGDTSAQVEFPQITSMDDDPDGLTSPHPWTKIRANMEVVWRKSDGSIRRHWAGNVFSRNVGNDGKSPFLRITALGSLRMAGNAINKPLNRQDPLDLGTIIPRTLNSVVSRRYNAVPHVTTGILSKKRGSWSDSALGFVQDCLADAWTLSGNQWTIAKIPGTRRAYEMRLKKTTPSWTITNGAMGVSVDLNKDGAVRNVIYGHGVRDDGGVWRNTFYFDGTDPNDGVRLPLAADPRTQKRILHPSGLGMMDNPDYDENIPAYEDDVDFGQCSVAVGTYSAQQIVDRESIPSLSGRITLRTDPREGSRVFIPAGDKIRVLGYEGSDVVLHIASVEVDYQSYEVTLEVSERSHDALTLAQIRSLQKDARRDPAMRPGNPNRRSRLEQDQTPPFDAESRAGIIAPRTAPGGQWSGQAYPFAGAGRIVKTHFEAGSPFAVAIFAKPISAAHLQSIVGNPLTNDNPFEPHLKVLENTYGLVACWGQKGQRMGYSPGREDNGGAFTGNFDEYQTWEYVSGDGVKLWVFVFPQSTTTFSGRCYPGAEL